MPPKKAAGKKNKNDDDWDEDVTEKKLAALKLKEEKKKEDAEWDAESEDKKPHPKASNEGKKAAFSMLMDDDDVGSGGDDSYKETSTSHHEVENATSTVTVPVSSRVVGGAQQTKKNEKKKSKKGKKGKQENDDDEYLDAILANLEKEDRAKGKIVEAVEPKEDSPVQVVAEATPDKAPAAASQDSHLHEKSPSQFFALLHPTNNKSFYIHRYSRDIQKSSNRILSLIICGKDNNQTIEHYLKNLEDMAKSSRIRDSEIIVCIISKLIESYQYMKSWKKEDIDTVANILGGLLRSGTVRGMDSVLALRLMMNSIEDGPDNLLWSFGIVMLSRLQLIMSTYPRLCAKLVDSAHFNKLPSRLSRYLICGSEQLIPLPSSSKSLQIEVSNAEQTICIGGKLRSEKLSFLRMWDLVTDKIEEHSQVYIHKEKHTGEQTKMRLLKRTSEGTSCDGIKGGYEYVCCASSSVKAKTDYLLTLELYGMPLDVQIHPKMHGSNRND